MRSVGRAKQASSNCALKHHWRGLHPKIQCSLHGKEDCQQYFVIVRDAQILGGGGVSHSTVMAYLDWRRDAETQGREIAPRTVLLEIKVLGIIMDEAIRRGFAIVNPCRRLGLSRVATREKPEITLDEEQLIRRELTTRPEWMHVSFDIAMAQGCRFKETRLRLSEVDLARRRILFRTKGGKVFETALNPVLIPMLRRLKRRGAEYTWDLPPNDMGHTARNWTRFFARSGCLIFAE